MRFQTCALFLFAACAPPFTWPEFRFNQVREDSRFAGVNAVVTEAVDTLTYSVTADIVSARLTRYRRDAVVAAVRVARKTIYLDPGCPACPLDRVSQALEGAQVVAIFDDGAHIEALPVSDAKDNATSLTVSLRIGTKSDASGSAQAVLSGVPAAMARAAYNRRAATDFAHALGMKDKLHLSNMQAPGAGQASQTFAASFDLASKCKDDGPGRMRCGLDMLIQPTFPELRREARTQDLILPGNFLHALTLSLLLPQKARVEPPPPVSAKSRFGEYSLHYYTEGGQHAITRRFVINAHRIPAVEYDEFHAFLMKARQFDAAAPAIALFAEETHAAPEAAAAFAEAKTPAKKSKT